VSNSFDNIVLTYIVLLKVKILMIFLEEQLLSIDREIVPATKTLSYKWGYKNPICNSQILDSLFSK